MKKLMSFAKLLMAVVFLVILGAVFVEYYPFIFSRRVEGLVVRVERLDTPLLMPTQPNKQPPSQVFSFAIGIEDRKTGEIVVASTEDRQWAAVEKGNCAEARFYVYPPWHVEKSGTYFNARLLKLYKNCDDRKE